MPSGIDKDYEMFDYEGNLTDVTHGDWLTWTAPDDCTILAWIHDLVIMPKEDSKEGVMTCAVVLERRGASKPDLDDEASLDDGRDNIWYLNTYGVSRLKPVDETKSLETKRSLRAGDKVHLRTYYQGSDAEAQAVIARAHAYILYKVA